LTLATRAWPGRLACPASVAHDRWQGGIHVGTVKPGSGLTQTNTETAHPYGSMDCRRIGRPDCWLTRVSATGVGRSRRAGRARRWSRRASWRCHRLLARARRQPRLGFGPKLVARHSLDRCPGGRLPRHVARPALAAAVATGDLPARLPPRLAGARTLSDCALDSIAWPNAEKLNRPRACPAETHPTSRTESVR
jgi:hypothetical protein